MTQVLLQDSTLRNSRRGERTFFIIVLGAFALLPPLFWEPFPLTKTPMFARPLQQLRLYELTDGKGRRLNNDLWGLRTNLNWYLEPFYAVKYPKTIVPSPDRAPDIARIIQSIRELALRQKAVFPLRFTCRVLGPEGETVGIVSSQTWLIEANPREVNTVAYATTQQAME